ncbi:MAG: helix-turn-helix domain-containing protein [Actinomycetota bacterium]|nr:helix-turn-helix domain-containing protein [Actinomycetota bacterium]
MSTPRSSLSDALVRIGDRWSLLVVDALASGPQRFAGLQDAVAGISTNILTARLRRLEAEGLLLAVPYSRRPLRFAYELTDAGRDLGGAVRMLTHWSARHDGLPFAGTPSPAAGTPAHALCGTPMEAVWWCPTCQVPGGADGDEAVWV